MSPNTPLGLPFNCYSSGCGFSRLDRFSLPPPLRFGLWPLIEEPPPKLSLSLSLSGGYAGPWNTATIAPCEVAFFFTIFPCS